MSDQVVFTKEEVEKIREALSFADKLNFQVYGGSEPYESALSILDSPRPRPKVKWSFLQSIYHRGHADCENGNNPTTGYIADICARYGFDVED